MTEADKERIKQMQRDGHGYKKISAVLGLPVNGVKSYCRRHPIERKEETVGCLHCGAALRQIPHRKKKKFCSDECRRSWWNAHPEQVNRKAYHVFICSQCGQKFESYGSKLRIYCSRQCYALARTKAVM